MEKPVVLIVEDEAIIRMETVEMVKDAGYAALEAPNACAALTLLEERSDIHAVFAEIRLSGSRNGMDLGRTIAERWPLVQLIMTSGGPEAEGFPAGWRYMPKPYNSAQLAAALRALFGPGVMVMN